MSLVGAARGAERVCIPFNCSSQKTERRRHHAYMDSWSLVEIADTRRQRQPPRARPPAPVVMVTHRGKSRRARLEAIRLLRHRGVAASAETGLRRDDGRERRETIGRRRKDRAIRQPCFRWPSTSLPPRITSRCYTKPTINLPRDFYLTPWVVYGAIFTVPPVSLSIFLFTPLIFAGEIGDWQPSWVPPRSRSRAVSMGAVIASRVEWKRNERIPCKAVCLNIRPSRSLSFPHDLSRNSVFFIF